MATLFEYAIAVAAKAGRTIVSGQVFAKVLTRNDDAGRHGVLIPSEAYTFFPNLPIPDPTQNATETFEVFDALSATRRKVAFKYYQRYPERRITCVHPILNDLDSGKRLFIALQLKHSDGTTNYYFDYANSALGGRFNELFRLIFGEQVADVPANFVIRPVDVAAFATDESLAELLRKFDEVKSSGWIDAMRLGDTGIGYTFETLLGIKENNDEFGDFRGIELKCQKIKEGRTTGTGKINLFQEGPVWLSKTSARDRIRILGQKRVDGLYACHSQLSTTANNLGLLLDVIRSQSKIDLRKHADPVGYWTFKQLEQRLIEKHSRAAFVKAKTRSIRGTTQYAYDELVYCDRPSIQKFIDLIDRRNIVFEFIMSERSNGEIRNHGYPWRLIRAEFLDNLFAFRIKLR